MADEGEEWLRACKNGNAEVDLFDKIPREAILAYFTKSQKGKTELKVCRFGNIVFL